MNEYNPIETTGIWHHKKPNGQWETRWHTKNGGYIVEQPEKPQQQKIQKVDKKSKPNNTRPQKISFLHHWLSDKELRKLFNNNISNMMDFAKENNYGSNHIGWMKRHITEMKRHRQNQEAQNAE